MTIYEKNMAVLRDINPSMAYAINSSNIDHVKVSDTPSGHKTLEIPSKDGSLAFVHSRFDPMKEAVRLVTDITPQDEQTFVFVGIGLGYHLLEVGRIAKDKSTFFIIEKYPEAIKASMSCTDWTGLLTRHFVIFCTGLLPDDFYTVLRQYVENFFQKNVKIINHAASISTDTEYYGKIGTNLRDFVKSGTIILATTMALPRKLIKNRINNIPYYFSSPGVKALHDAYKGVPAIVVSAGPSLQKNIHLLKGIADRAIVVSVSTSTKRLLSEGIKPQFTAVIDYHDVSKRYFENIETDDIIMLAHPAAHSNAIKTFKGPVLFNNDPTINLLLRGVPQDKGEMQYGSTVAHLAFIFADYIGANPIILVGQDLSYPDGVTHVPGTAIYDQWKSETNKFLTNEMKEWEYIQRYKTQLSKIEDVHGNMIYTDANMLSYLKDFGILCMESKALCLNATEGGAKIHNTTNTTLKEAIDKYCLKKIPVQPLDLLSKCGSKTGNISSALAELKSRLTECHKLKKYYKNCIVLLEKSIVQNEKHGDGNRTVIKVVKMRDAIADVETHIFPILKGIAKTDTMEIERLDRKMSSSVLTGVEKQIDQAKRDILYLKALELALDDLTNAIKAQVDDMAVAGREGG